MYRGCHMLVLGALLHLETSTLFKLCHKLVRRARYQKKREKKKRKKRERRSYSSHKSQNHYTTFFIDNVAFAEENTNETYEAIKNWSLAAPKNASLATDTEKQTKQTKQTTTTTTKDQYQESSFCKAKKQKQQTNKQTLNSKYFLQHQHTRGLQRHHTSTTTKTWVACGNSPDMRVNTRYINSTRGTSSKRSTARFDLSVVDG